MTINFSKNLNKKNEKEKKGFVLTKFYYNTEK